MDDPHVLSVDDDEGVIDSDPALGQPSLLSLLNLHLPQPS